MNNKGHDGWVRTGPATGYLRPCDVEKGEPSQWTGLFEVCSVIGITVLWVGMALGLIAGAWWFIQAWAEVL